MLLYGHQDEQRDQFTYHKDSETVECPAVITIFEEQGRGRKTCQRLTYSFDVEKCKTSPLQEGCYKPDTKEKAYSIASVPEFKRKAMEYHQTKEFKNRYRMR